MSNGVIEWDEETGAPARTCAKQGCTKRVQGYMKYCSRDHAPLGNYGFGSSGVAIKSAPMEDSGQPARGARSRPFARGGYKTKSDTFETARNKKLIRKQERNEMQQSENIIKPIERPVRPSNGATGAQRQKSGESESHKSASSEPEITTQLEDSFAPSVSSSEETLTSMSLIDDSAEQMHGLMTSLAARLRAKTKTAEYITHIEVGQVTRCAAELRSLLRLKLDIWKERKQK